MSKKLATLLILPILLIVSCKGNKEPTVYLNVEWEVNKENGYVDVRYFSSDTNLLEWKNLDDNLNTIYAKWDGSNIFNRFFDYHNDYYKLVIYHL